MALREYSMSKNPISDRLTPQQEEAINLILAGQNDGDVAEIIGKSRSTVNVWRNHDPLFIATLNDRRQQIWGGQLNRLNTLASEAVDALQDGLHDSDIKVRLAAAVHILKATSVYGATPHGTEETDPAELAADLHVKEKERDSLVSLGSLSWSGNELEFDTRAEQRRRFFGEERDRQVSDEIEEISNYFKTETNREEIAYWERLLPAYAEIPQDQLDALDEDALRQLALDFVKARDLYLKTLKKGLTDIANPDRPVWDDYTKEVESQVDATVERAKARTDAVLQIFIDAWERRGGEPADLLDRSKRKKGARNPMLQPHRLKLPVDSDPQPPALSAPEDAEEA